MTYNLRLLFKFQLFAVAHILLRSAVNQTTSKFTENVQVYEPLNCNVTQKSGADFREYDFSAFFTADINFPRNGNSQVHWMALLQFVKVWLIKTNGKKIIYELQKIVYSYRILKQVVVVEVVANKEINDLCKPLYS